MARNAAVCELVSIMNITFWGAAKQVTGSMHMLTLASGYTILVDCGLDYEHRKTFEEDNRYFPFDPAAINLVVLTHAHIDHSGNLPNLIKQGFSGQILCTDVTVPLTRFLLFDSLTVQQIEHKKAKARKIKKSRKHKVKTAKSAPTLYSHTHVEHTVDRMIGIAFNRDFDVNENVSLRFYPAGHILGAASVAITLKENGRTVRIGFTGDLGNYQSKLVRDPVAMPNLDYLVTESTYGGRQHVDKAPPEDILLEYVNNTCVKYNGKLIIPAFSVGRTQAIIFTFHQLFSKGLLPHVKIYTDSPLAIRTTRLYHQNLGELNDEARAFYEANGNLFEFENLYTIEDPKESEMVSLYNEPAVIISAAGMVEGGRIQEHIRMNIANPYATILIAGYCAEGTLGYDLLQGRPTVKINKRERQVYAKVARTDAFSAHPDQTGLLRYFNESNVKQMRQVFLVHGEPQMMEALKSALGENNVTIPEKGQCTEL